MKQTAVEFLADNFHYYYSTKWNDILEQAKEMEKQQMRSASCPYIGGWEDDEFEYWYSEKFNK